jgi:hypothetical protein
LERLHRSLTNAFALALGIGSHGLDVADGAPGPVTKPDPSRYSTGMSNEAVAISGQHVHTAISVVGVLVAEAIAESPPP